MKTLLRLSLGLFLLVTPRGLRAQTVAATPPAGYWMLTARGASDSMLSVPLVKRSALLARVTGVGQDTITLAADGVADGAYAPGSGGSYYAQFVSGALEGLCYRILGNVGGELTLATDGEDLRSHALGVIAAGDAGDLVRIRPCWTVADVFGADGATLRLDPVADLATGPYLASDAILLPDNGAAGTEKRPLTISYVTGAGWRAPGSPLTDLAAQPLPLGAPFVVRRQRADPVEMVLIGYVSQEPFQLRILALASGEDRDVAVALAHPVDRNLADSGLFSTVTLSGAITASLDALNVRDVLLEFDPERRGFALPPARRFHVVGTGWHESDAAADDHILQSGAGYLLRLRGERAVRYWVQAAPVWNP
jgi:uncharacterized protein (TIGR02597 family)